MCPAWLVCFWLTFVAAVLGGERFGQAKPPVVLSGGSGGKASVGSPVLGRTPCALCLPVHSALEQVALVGLTVCEKQAEALER